MCAYMSRGRGGGSRGRGFVSCGSSRGGSRGGGRSGSRGAAGTLPHRPAHAHAQEQRRQQYEGHGSRVPNFPVVARHSAATTAAHVEAPTVQQQQQQQQQQQRTSRVATVLTSAATELPRKLNTKIFIDGLPYNYTPEPGKPSLEDELIAFATAWKVGKALRLIKKSGQGFGFLVLRSPNSVEAAVRVLNGRKFLGRTLRVEAAKAREEDGVGGSPDADTAGAEAHTSSSSSAAAAAAAHGGKRDGVVSYHRQVLVSDLGKAAQPEILREVLRDVAPQLEAKLEAVKMTSRNRKAFLTFASPDDVPAALAFLDGLQLLGRRIAAARAAAPGTLPYSRTPPPAAASSSSLQHQQQHQTAAAATTMASSADCGVADAPLLVPLGMTVAATAAAVTTNNNASTRQRRAAEAAEAAAAAATAVTRQQQQQPSNVTGKTSKYNLLDDGPADVYVGNLSEAITEQMLRAHFASCGAMRSCTLLVHRDTHTPLGIAHIVFALPAYAAYAQQTLHGSRLHGCVLRVDRGDVASPPLACDGTAGSSSSGHGASAEEGDADGDDAEEAAFLRLYGVRDKATLLRRAAGDVSDDDDDDDEDGDDEAVVVAQQTGKLSKRKRARDHDDGEESEEERFHDVDIVDATPTVTRSVARGAARGGGRGRGRGAARKQRTGTAAAASSLSAAKKRVGGKKRA